MTAPVGTVAEDNRRGDFLTRTGVFAGPLSLALMVTPYMFVIAGDLLAGRSYAIDPWALVQSAALTIPLFILAAACLAIVVTLPLGGILLWLCWLADVDPVATRWNATRFGALGGALVALIEIASVLISFSTNVFVVDHIAPTGLAFGNAGEPTLLTWLKFAADLIVTVLIGSVSARLAWRPSISSLAPTHAKLAA